MPDLGKKFTCFNCGTKFYNLGKPEAICPKCGA
ncbi:MAG: FYDLN acid domain-containing protein, partial [Pseudomonadota bacterium]